MTASRSSGVGFSEESSSPLPAPAASRNRIPSEPLLQDGALEVEDNDFSDAATAGDRSDTASISSSIYRGVIENGRRYQTTREGEYWGPSDDKQWESMNLSHLVYLVLDCQEKNPLFRSPVGDNAQNILDLGTGQGDWAIDVADRFSAATVSGVDLYPPPQKWLPSNCVLEVDDIAKPWTWSHKFDFIHLRYMLGSFTNSAWDSLYKQAYENLEPGGWIEQVEPGLDFTSDDASLPADSKMAAWGEMFYRIGTRKWRPMDTFRTMKDRIAFAGFVNIQEHTYKIPIGTWPKHQIYKEAGRLALEQLETGLEGYALFLLTKFGEPEPWTTEQVKTFLTAVREELRDKNYHSYTLAKRVWAQKPFDV